MSQGSSQPPGWYPAQGDPPGTHRYWDGAQWVGGPQPIADSPQPMNYGQQAGYAYGTGVSAHASYGSRVIAYLIDYGIGLAIFVVAYILALIFGSFSDSLATVFLIVGYLALFGYGVWNTIIRQGQTGQTIGKAQQNIKLVSLDTGQPVGIGMAIVRQIVMFLFSLVCYIPLILDLLWPLWDENGQRLTDKVITANVVQA
ncbi:MAG: RDD family protein [Acidimicrobiales bacterium]